MKGVVPYLTAIVLVSVAVCNGGLATDTSSTAVAADSAPSLQWVRAEIRKIDAENSKVTLRHEALTQLSMGAMTMVFRVDDAALLKRFAVGDRVKFIPDSRAGQLYVIFMEKDD